MEQFDGGVAGNDAALLVSEPAARPEATRCGHRGTHGLWRMLGDGHRRAIRSVQGTKRAIRKESTEAAEVGHASS